MKRFLVILTLISTFAIVIYILLNYWSFVFARTVAGEVFDVQRVDASTAILGNRATKDKDLFSFAIAVKEISGEIVTGSSEDRQWAVVKVGQCVEVKFYPYPPWDLNKAGTYYNARLLKLKDCGS